MYMYSTSTCIFDAHIIKKCDKVDPYHLPPLLLALLNFNNKVLFDQVVQIRKDFVTQYFIISDTCERRFYISHFNLFLEDCIKHTDELINKKGG